MSRSSRSTTRNKILAVLAAGVVLSVGGALTLAAWNDTEWVFGGNAAGTGPGIGTTTFEVQQDVSKPFAAPGTFSDHETNPGQALIFGTGALALTPGDVVYAPVALRSTTASVAGTLQLNAATTATGITINDTGNLLGNALVLSVGTATTTTGNPPTCDLAGFGSYTPIALTGTGLTAVPAVGTQSLTAAGANTQHYCFRISLPSNAPDTVQGRTVAPAWAFTATSN